MAKFAVVAEVLTSDHFLMKAFAAGVTKKMPGEVLRDVLERSGGAYETTLPLSPSFREQIRKVAELTSDEHLLAISDLSELKVSLEHLRGVAPDTRVVIGADLSYAEGESERLGLGKQSPPDPKTTILVSNYPGE